MLLAKKISKNHSVNNDFLKKQNAKFLEKKLWNINLLTRFSLFSLLFVLYVSFQFSLFCLKKQKPVKNKKLKKDYTLSFLIRVKIRSNQC